MKLRNKKTGEIIILIDHIFDNYKNLAELCEEWEDYKEPIQVYIEGIQNVFMSGGRVYIDYATAKEAELAVRKLKAWKRLKEARINFKDYHYELEDNDALITYKLEIEADGFAYEDFTDDLNLLFGGEE